jgi:opacity protein-like surface antigen
MTARFLLIGVLAVAGSAQAQTSIAQPPSLSPGDQVVVEADRTIRGRLANITTDSLVFEGANPPDVPFSAIARIDRVGDSVFNGTAIGAAVGGGATLALMGKICSNTNCSDTSSNLDPRLTLLGTLIGAGVGAIIDATIDGRKTVYTSGAPKPVMADAAQPSAALRRISPMIFGRVGWARLTDDEGSLGSGGTVGVGAIVQFTPRIAVQASYDRHTHRRDLESPGPPGSTASGGFTGTEQLLTAKALFFFHADKRVRPYAGIGLSYLDSERVSTFPTFVPQPNGFPTPGPPEIFRYHTQGAGLGFAAGMDVRVTRRLSVLGDLTLDLNNPDALGSTRLTVGAGWRF